MLLESFEQYEEGSVMKLFVTSVQPVDRELTVINKRGHCYQRLREVNLAGRIEEYATEVEDSYVPVEDELCVVEHGKFLSSACLRQTNEKKNSRAHRWFADGRWHRALSLGASERSNKIKLDLIDSGEIIEAFHTDIRRIPKEFVTPFPCLLIICKVIGNCRFEFT